ncbi:hypothetical protein FA15DRAFT_742899, partial [Coprinopsis marcescibilis]
CLSNLGNSFNSRFERTGDLPDIGKAIASLERAVELTPPGHADLPARLHNLGSSLRSRFERTGDLPDICKAIASQERARAVELTPPGHADLPARLHNLGSSLRSRFERTGDLPDICKAIASQERAVELTPPGHADLSRGLNHLGSSFQSRFERTGDLPDIGKAIASQEKALKITPPGHADLPECLNNLGSAFHCRFERTGDLPDIGKAIASLERAVELTPPGHADLPARLHNLGSSLRSRFERTGDLPDICKAIASQERAVELTPPGHADLSRGLNHLGSSFQSRFERTGDLPDIGKAIASLERAVELTPPGHADLPACLSNLGNSFNSRFERTGDLPDIGKAIASLERAVELTPPGHADLPARLNNLGNSFRGRFKRTGDLPDIGKSIVSLQRAVELTPPGHADLPVYLRNLGSSFSLRFDNTQSFDDLDKALAYYKRAGTSSAGPPSVRFDAAQEWALLSHDHFPDSPETLLAFETAVRLVPVIAGLEQTVQHRHSTLHSISTFTLLAAAAACSLERPEKALEWLEQGRCLVWSQLNYLRTPLDDLRVVNSSLANRYSDISKALEIAGSRTSESAMCPPTSTSDSVSAAEEALSHLKLAAEWNSVLATIRTTVPGFENFLMPPPCSSLLQNLPDTGPIIIINVHKDSCDALALMAGHEEPFHIPLPCFSFGRAETLRTDLTELLRSFGMRVREDVQGSEIGEHRKPRQARTGPHGETLASILATLWIDVVKPILDALGFSVDEHRSLSELPRIWWCATGPLAFLPLHSAGIYDDEDSDAIFDYAVSSYTPTVTSLTSRVKNALTSLDDTSGLFMVSQPDTPGLSRIPGTREEVRAIQTQLTSCGVRERMLEGSAATIEEGLRSMENYNNVHFACHAIQNKDDPLYSGFHFHDGPLSLSTIIKKKLKNANLAFLSACQTSTGEEKLSEEAVHLAAGMLAAGYHGVVGTMWSISDNQAPEVAKDFYEYLLAGGGAGIDASRASYALHHAIQSLRRRSGNSEHSLLTWVPYVHFGV